MQMSKQICWVPHYLYFDMRYGKSRNGITLRNSFP